MYYRFVSHLTFHLYSFRAMQPSKCIHTLRHFRRLKVSYQKADVKISLLCVKWNALPAL